MASRMHRRDVAPPTPDANGIGVSESIPVEPTAAGLEAARAFVRDTLTKWTLQPAVSNAVLDIAHELVSNAVQHATAPITLELLLEPARVRVIVRDASEAPVRRLPYRAGVSEHGLGIRLVAQLSTMWGQQLEAQGKSVWAVVNRRTRAERAAPQVRRGE